jgi:hypothetical protein
MRFVRKSKAQLASERGERNERGGLGLGHGLGRLPRRLGINAVYPSPQLPVLVAKLPIGLRQALEPLGQASSSHERHDRDYGGRSGEQPLKGQQTSYLSERLATVSTA